MRLHTNRTGTRATTTMRRTTCFVQVKVHHVKAHVTRTCDTEDCIGIRTIVVELSTHLVDQASNLYNIRVEESKRIWIGQHDGCDIFPLRRQNCTEALHVDATGLWV